VHYTQKIRASTIGGFHTVYHSARTQSDTYSSRHFTWNGRCSSGNSTGSYILRVVALFVAFGLAVSEPLLAQTEYTDTEFHVANDWSIYGPYITRQEAMNAAFSAEQESTGGNHMKVMLTRATVDSGEIYTWGAVINDKLIWDPAEEAQGPIDSPN